MERISDKQAQQLTARFLQMVYTFMFTLIGFPLMIVGSIGLDQSWIHEGSYTAMVIVGVLLLALAFYSAYILYRMIIEYKKGKTTDLTAVLAATTLNIYGFMLINESNGKVKPKNPKKAKDKK